MPNITKRFVESITPDPKKLTQYWDTTLKGFGVIVLPSGRCTYCIQYRNKNRVVKRLKIGVHGQIRTEEARAMAKNHLGAITQGRDPAEQKKVVSALPTMADLAKEYMERHGTRKRTSSQVEDRGMLKKYILPAFAHQPVSQVTFHDIQSLHLKLKDTPYRANRIMALLSSMFSLSISWSWRPDNPVRGIKKYQEEKRDRWLDEEELNRLWAVLDTYPSYLTAYVFKFLLLTGARKSEVTQATWNQFDLKKGVWTKPSHMTKQKKKEHLPLSEKALEVLEILRKLNTENSPYLFPGRVPGEPLKTITNF